jgi:hypothetical protein
MEYKAASLGKKSTAIVVQQNLLRFVRGAAEGERFLEGSNKTDLKNPNLEPERLDWFEQRMGLFLDEFADAMGESRFKDRESLHLTSPGWGALGILFHDLAVRLEVPDLAAAAHRLGGIDWHRSAPTWREIVREREDKDGNPVLGLAGGGAQTRRFITATLRAELGIGELLRERGFLDESLPGDEEDLEAA